jgi:hypothetical protein
MTDTDIRTALERATGDLSSPPDLLERVRAGGHRRVVRRRAVLGAGLATVVAGSAAGVGLSRDHGDRRAPVASPLLDGPTRGDLREDTAYLDSVRAAWRDHVGSKRLVGEPKVVWAGTAPHDSRAAVVAQRVREEVASPIGQIDYGMIGFVEQTPAGPVVISLEQMLTLASNSAVALLGPDRDVVMILDDGRDARYSPRFTYDAGGRIRRTFTAPDFRAHDGVFFATAGKQNTSVQIAVRAGRRDGAGSLAVGLANQSALIEAAGGGRPGSGWSGSERLDRRLPGRDRAWPADADLDRDGLGPWDLSTREGYADTYGYWITPAVDTWLIRGATADRRRFVVQTLTAPDGRSRVFLQLETPDAVLNGFTDPGAALTLQVRLPDRQGVVVAAGNATLRYRTRAGGWLPVTGDAALLPDAAREVEVTRAGARPVLVPLRG